MGLLQSIVQYFSNHCETSERHEDPLLRTHYYKTTSSKAFQKVSEIIGRMDGYHITSYSKEHGEFGVEIKLPKKGFMVISVISVRPFETAIDFSITYEGGLMNLGFCRDVVIGLFDRLNQELEQIK